MSNQTSQSIQFFETQFARQVAASDYALNPFEQEVLAYLQGNVLDLGCGLGNLALAAAAKGCRVTALDASETAVNDLARRARQLNLPIETHLADLRRYRCDNQYDGVVSIGLLMFFAEDDAKASLAGIAGMVKAGGIAAINVLIEGTTFTGMFDPAAHYLFGEHEIEEAFPGWKTEFARTEIFPAPDNTIKRFRTVVLQRPAD